MVEKIYLLYQKPLKENNMLDFEDIINVANHKLSRNYTLWYLRKKTFSLGTFCISKPLNINFVTAYEEYNQKAIVVI